MQNWSKGVEQEQHGAGRYRTVKSTEHAAQRLLAYWPRGKGKAFVEAQHACLVALEGASSPELAREALLPQPFPPRSMFDRKRTRAKSRCAAQPRISS